MKRRTGYLIQRGKTWYACWTVSGKKFMRTTGKGDRRDAEKELRRIMEPFALGDEVTTLENIAARIKGRTSEMVRLDEEANPPLTLADAWKAYDASPMRPDSGDSTLRGYRNRFSRFTEWAKKHHPAALAIRDVTPAMAAEYAQDLSGDKVSASTFNQSIGFLRLLWKTLDAAARTGGVNPWNGIARRKLQKLENRKRPLTPAQFAAVEAAAAADPDLRDLLTVLAWTGQRLVDALKLRWETVNFHGRVITLYPGKTARRTGRAVHIPIFPALMDVLNRRHAAMPHTTAAAYVFPALVEEYDRDLSSVSKRIQAILEKAGLKVTEERTGLKRAVVLYGAHSFRHLFVTAAASAGIPPAVIRSITGHSSEAMSEHYQQFDARLSGEFAKRLTGKKPAALKAGRAPMPGWTRKGLKSMTPENWQSVRAELLKPAPAKEKKAKA